MAGLERFHGFTRAMGMLLSAERGEAEILEAGAGLLLRLIATDDWLPPAFAVPHPEYYRQYLLHRDAAERFSVVSFVWGPGQKTPVHDHTVWGLVGVMRGAELCQRFDRDAAGALVAGETQRLQPGDVDAVSPRIGDIHTVANAFGDRVSVSIHVYGADIGAVRRHVFKPDGTIVEFVSGYANAGPLDPAPRT
ncbi:MAG: cysteine dioxygenase [Alphaproteobacteria bacterium]|nr:cysteine dioxygenase [Alphaproteobacteria bacterium]